MDEFSTPEALPEELLGLVKPELQPGERLLWAATALPRPPSVIRSPVRASIFTAISFSTSAGAFYLIFGPTRPKFLSVEGLLCGLGVIAFVSGLFSAFIVACAALDKWSPSGRLALNTYALTDRRAIIWVPQSSLNAVEVHAFARGSFKTIHRLEYPDGSGSVRFAYPTEEFPQGPTGFEGVSDVRRVEELARRTLIDPGPTRPT